MGQKSLFAFRDVAGVVNSLAICHSRPVAHCRRCVEFLPSVHVRTGGGSISGIASQPCNISCALHSHIIIIAGGASLSDHVSSLANSEARVSPAELLIPFRLWSSRRSMP